jgi:hypothetical protein
LRKFRLFGTSACHLCEIAQGMLVQQREMVRDFTFDSEDISGSDALFEQYGLRIPVLQHPDQRELDWPFSDTQLQQFLRS